MSSINSISVEKLARLIGTPKCPAIVDVRTEEDYAADPRLIPGSVYRRYAAVPDWAGEFKGRPVVVTCQRGLKLSQGAAAWLRHSGIAADALEGGLEAWIKADLPLVPQAKLPPRDSAGRTVWVTRERPKI